MVANKIQKTGIGQAVQRAVEKTAEKHLIEDDPYYNKYKQQKMEKQEKKDSKEKEKQDKKDKKKK